MSGCLLKMVNLEGLQRGNVTFRYLLFDRNWEGNGGITYCRETLLHRQYFVFYLLRLATIVFAMLYCAGVLAGPLSPRFATLLRDVQASKVKKTDR